MMLLMQSKVEKWCFRFRRGVDDLEKGFPTIDKVKTGKRIRSIMNSLGLTVIDVQKYMGFSTQQAVYHWLNGRSIPSLDNMYALSELFKVPVDQIICGNRKYQPKYEARYYRMNAYAKYMVRLGVVS